MSNETANLMTRGQIVDAVADFIQDTAENRKAMIRVAVDMAFRDALQRYDWPGLVRWKDAAVTVAQAQAYFHAPEEARSLITVIDSTVPFQLSEFDLLGLVSPLHGDVNISGSVVAYGKESDVAINEKFASATALELVSDAADTRTVWMTGFQSDAPVRKSFVLNGTMPVAVGTWDDVTEMSVATTNATNTVSLRKVTEGTVVSRIRPRFTSVNFQRFRLAAVPAQSTVLRLIYRYTPPPIFDDAHVFPIPVQTYLMQFAIASSFQSRRQWAPARDHFALAQEFLLSAIGEAERGRVRMPRPMVPGQRMRTVSRTE